MLANQILGRDSDRKYVASSENNREAQQEPQSQKP
jgi:hypothetical protein